MKDVQDVSKKRVICIYIYKVITYFYFYGKEAVDHRLTA